MTLSKAPNIRSKRLREWARGNDHGCQIRLPGCQHSPTVGSHVPSGYGKGIGYKPPDILIALSCDVCHGVVDGRIKTQSLSRDERMLAWYSGFAETLLLAIREGLVEVK